MYVHSTDLYRAVAKVHARSVKLCLFKGEYFWRVSIINCINVEVTTSLKLRKAPNFQEKPTKSCQI